MKNLFLVLALALSVFATAQNEGAGTISINVTQDTKLAFFGDDKGNEAFTPDIVIRTEWRGNQFNGGYMFVAPEFEYADLQGGIYRRYSANVGWTFNNWVNNINFTASAGFGTLDYNGARFSFGANLQTSIIVAKGIEFVLDLETTERKDLLQYPSTNEILGTAWRVSGKFGVKVAIFDTNSNRR